MPHWIIYHPPDTFTDEATKQALAKDLSDNYSKARSMPAFYVVVTFIPVPDNSMFVGGEVARSRGKPFIRISVAHIHINIKDIDADESKHDKIFAAMMERFNKVLKPHIEDKGYDWEYHIDETDRRLWMINGVYAPPWQSEDEKVWKFENRAVPPHEMEHAQSRYQQEECFTVYTKKYRPKEIKKAQAAKTATKPQTSTKPMMENDNVVGGRLALFSKDPLVGFFRDGFCRTGPEDSGNHSIAATMTSGFLDFTASKGNNLKDVGVKAGQKWCLCASRWQEAMKAAQEGQLKKEDVPKVNLSATHEAALKQVSCKDLKNFAAEGDAHGNHRQESHYNPEKNGAVAKEHGEISSYDLSLAPGAGSHNKTGEVKGVRGQRG